MNIVEKLKFTVQQAKNGNRLAQAALVGDAVIYGGIAVLVLWLVF